MGVLSLKAAKAFERSSQGLETVANQLSKSETWGVWFEEHARERLTGCGS